MDLIANPVTSKCCSNSEVNYLTYENVTQETFTAATNLQTAELYQTWKTANPTLKVLTTTAVMGADALPLLLVEASTITGDATNNLVSQTLINAPTGIELDAALQAWKTSNPYQKIQRITLMTGADGGVDYLVEYAMDATAPGLKNNQVSQTYFPDGGTTAYAQYETWKTANPSVKPYRINYSIASNGDTGIILEYTNYGSSPNSAQISQQFIPNDNSTGIAGFADNVSVVKTADPLDQILRITPIFQGVLIETTLNGITAPNYSRSQSFYSADPTGVTATDAYQVFKAANTTLKPVSLTSMVWGDGSSGLLAEYIS